MNQFSYTNFLAHTLIRQNLQPKIAPCWLCFSEDAKNEAIKLAADFINNNIHPIIPVQVDQIDRMNKILEPLMKDTIQQWINMEVEYEKRRHQNHPLAYFCPN